jgi:hypothetical protein
MYIASLVVTIILIAALSFSVWADFVRYDKVLVAMDRAGVKQSWLPLLGVLKAAAALGLVAGLAVPPIGIAAGAGVVVFFVGAILTHVRARYYSFGAPAFFLTFGVAALALTIAVL